MDLVFTKEANARARACMLHERHLLQLVGMRRASAFELLCTVAQNPLALAPQSTLDHSISIHTNTRDHHGHANGAHERTLSFER